ncbi:TAXI family TRAP transporter solute-binding subunit [Hoeflea sp.]|nr:TAXI family TRAP transporter solute-binding subunit [Hoeflea sp.]MBU4528999.1 TAXI family TRAP transporter solute-binding subunit [Alphaproteobacteria bacterium]MBU4543404.1 TAXI family TRAP transporter solute-binding subunit [Alphaproteobacteria bacterium]MBU4549029.1 TAXI family TRAP transporter solute-binding subunit [Alphaproteobacteria bacterium]MBV1785125.1 TAXI family TRAP transporter solute-binding subunit [Hoeflea sp.]
MNLTRTIAASAFLALSGLMAAPVAAQVAPPSPVMSAASQSPGSLYVTYVAAWIEQVQKAFNGLTISQEPGGAAQNIVLVNNGDTDFGISNGPQAYQAVHGFGWTNGETYDKIAALHPAYPALTSVFTLASSDIEMLADLNGRNVGIGLPGGGSDVVSGQLFEHLGITPSQRIAGSWEDTAGMLRDGLVDAVFYLAGHPAGFIQELEIGRELRFIGLEAADMESFLEAYPYYGTGTLKAGVYTGITEDMPTLVQMNFMFGRPDLPDDFVTALLESVYDNVDGLAAVHPDFVNTSFENVANIPVPFHPAAEKFYADRSVKMNVPAAPEAPK